MTQSINENIKKAVREQYGNVAKSNNSGCGCSTPSAKLNACLWPTGQLT